MTLNEYQQLAARTINKNLSLTEQMHHALYGLSGEVGEIHSLFQKEFQGHPIELNDLQKEMGDVLWMLAELCTSFGWNLDNIADQNIAKLKTRYPDGFSTEKSINRKG